MAGCSFDFFGFDDLIAGPVPPGHDSRKLEGRNFTLSAQTAPLVAAVAERSRPVLAQPLAVGARVFDTGEPVEIAFAVLTAQGETFLSVRIGGATLGLAGPRPGQAFTVARLVDLRAATPPDHAEGFVAGTLIETPDGARPADALSAGDAVLTVDGGTQTVRRTFRRDLGVAQLIAHPHLRPVLFDAGALDNRHPLVVAPQQRLRVAGWRVELLFGAPETCVPAATLLNGRSIRTAPLHGPVTLFRLDFDGAATVTAEGISCLCAPPDAASAAPPAMVADTREPALRVAQRLDPQAAPLRPYQARHLRSR